MAQTVSHSRHGRPAAEQQGTSHRTARALQPQRRDGGHDEDEDLRDTEAEGGAGGGEARAEVEEGQRSERHGEREKAARAHGRHGGARRASGQARRRLSGHSPTPHTPQIPAAGRYVSTPETVPQ